MTRDDVVRESPSSRCAANGPSRIIIRLCMTSRRETMRFRLSVNPLLKQKTAPNSFEYRPRMGHTRYFVCRNIKNLPKNIGRALCSTRNSNPGPVKHIFSSNADPNPVIQTNQLNSGKPLRITTCAEPRNTLNNLFVYRKICSAL